MLDLSSHKKVLNAVWWTTETNQLYHPTGQFGQDSQQLVYVFYPNRDLKFLPILLKEWFYLVKSDGYLIIDYVPGKTLNFRKLEELMWWLWKGRYTIISHSILEKKDEQKLTEEKLTTFIKEKKLHLPYDMDKKTELQQGKRTQTEPIHSGQKMRFICQKTKSTQVEGDTISKWTFGIVTNGKRMDWMEEIISSIKRQNIPHYEIIVCGTYVDRKEKNFRYIPFNQRDDLGWITKKKNLIVQNATYENLCIIHDRAIFPKDWFQKMKKYGNCFEIMCNKQLFNGMRAYDWTTLGGKNGTLYKMLMLDYRDWDWWSVIGGLQTISKRHILLEVPFDETRYWNQMEDSELTFNLRDAGYIARINDATTETLGFRHGLIPSKPFNKQFYMPDLPLRRMMRSVARVSYKMPFIHANLERFCNTKLYKKITKTA